MAFTKGSTRARSMLGVAAMAAMTALPQAQAPPRAPAVAPEMMLVGCLRAGSNPSGIPHPITYTLEPIETTAPAAVAGTDLTRPKSGTRYTLTSEKTIEFASLVDQKVEITGRLKDLSADAPAATKPADKAPPQPGGAHNTFEVATLKPVAAKCP